MKQVMMGLSMAIFTVGAAHAQDAPRKTMEDRADARTQQMVKELGLSEEQAAKVKEINARFGAKFDAMQEQNRKEMEARNEKRDALRQEQANELKGVLTPEQFAKWEAKQEEMKARRLEHREGMRKEGEPGKGLQMKQERMNKAKPAPAPVK